MTIYCDESGGLNAGAMTFAAVMLTPEAAAQIHARFRAVTGLRGELKGSRISLTERAYLLELFDRAGGRAWVAVAKRAQLQPPANGQPTSDLALYAALLDLAIGSWLPETAARTGCRSPMSSRTASIMSRSRHRVHGASASLSNRCSPRARSVSPSLRSFPERPDRDAAKRKRAAVSRGPFGDAFVKFFVIFAIFIRKK